MKTDLDISVWIDNRRFRISSCTSLSKFLTDYWVNNDEYYA